MNFNFLPRYFAYFNDGMIITLIISLFVVLLGTLLGILIALGKISKIKALSFILSAYIELFRNTPMLIQITLGYLFLGANNFPHFRIGILSEDLGRLIPGILIISLNSGAYMAEIVRAGIEAVPAGQREAAYSLGLRPTSTMASVILPQAIRNILPAVGNEFVTIIKDSSLLSTIAVTELFNGAQNVANLTYQTITPFIVATVYYFVVCFVLSRVLARFEKKLGKGYAK